MEYLLQEIYGIENKSKQQRGTRGEEEGGGSEGGGDSDDDDDDEEDLGTECVICITDPKDTILLPCRHLCLCNSCGECRAAFACCMGECYTVEPLLKDTPEIGIPLC